MNGPIELTTGQVVTAGALIAVSAILSLRLQLGLHGRLLWASARCVVQLLLIGCVLRWIFKPNQPWYVIASLAIAMSLIAGFVAIGRSERRYAGMLLDSVVSVWACSWFVTVIVLAAVVRPEPWYQPQYAIPFLGMILHNTLNGISLGLNRLGNDLVQRRRQIETLLALGATRWEAARSIVQQAIRTGMIPTINAMTVMGIVSLPGMMTGQLVAGVDPIQAVKYQMVIMFAIAAASALGTFGVVLLAYRRLFSADHQFLPDRIRTVRE
ncbi:MAG: iron export ABC transporter permease subunit FetB [Pirellulales bacterium]|nr:iron export ABC transporter permease subunit FetB [Pirellulales bacterium]